jgi:hypothetical protein
MYYILCAYLYANYEHFLGIQANSFKIFFFDYQICIFFYEKNIIKQTFRNKFAKTF